MKKTGPNQWEQWLKCEDFGMFQNIYQPEVKSLNDVSTKKIRAINFLKHSKIIAVKNIDIVFSSNHLLCSQYKTRDVFAETLETKEDESSTVAPIAALNWLSTPKQQLL